MCIQVIERHALCGCNYYTHAVDPCPKAGTNGHQVQKKYMLVGYWCSRHAARLASDTESPSKAVTRTKIASKVDTVNASVSSNESSTAVTRTKATSNFNTVDTSASNTSFTRSNHVHNKETAVYDIERQSTRPTFDIDPRSTVHSVASSLDYADRQDVIENLVYHITKDMMIGQSAQLAPDELDELDDHITSLLTSFAVRIGCEAMGRSSYLRAMVFVDYYRGTIARRIVRRLNRVHEDEFSSSSEAKEPWRDLTMSLPATERITSWLTELDPLSGPDMEPEPSTDMEWPLPASRDEYIELTLSSAAYQWLLGQLYREFTMQIPGSHDMTSIKKFVLEDCEAPFKISRKTAPEVCTAMLLIDWNLDTYVFDQSSRLKERGWPESSVMSINSIEYAITVTGSSSNAQASTCGTYLDQVWPKIGRELLDLVIAFNQGSDHQRHLTGGVEISLIRDSEGLQITMHGTIFIIAEIIEIFGWLSSTFRSQPLADGPYCYMARIEKDPKTMPVVKADRIYRLDWDVQRPNADSKNVCWYNMFASPTIVLGYPIARRAEQETGLEIPMAIIEVLLQNASIHVLDNRLYLKGFAAMLIPTKRSGKLLMWHYQYNENGNYIDFLEADVGQMEPVDYHELGRYRHIVGWSQEAIFNVGSPWQEGQFIGPSELDPPTRTYGFKTFSISGGYMGVNFAFPVVLGIKDPPKWIEPNFKAIEHKIDHLSRIFVVLWDTADHRGWLIDGVSALLHLLRGSLEMSRKRFRSTFQLDLKDLIEPHLQNNGIQYPEAAEEFFLCDGYHNLSLTVFQGVRARASGVVTKQQVDDSKLKPLMTEYTSKQMRNDTTVEDEFLQLWSMLAHIAFRAKQVIKKNQDGIEARREDITCMPYLLGWDFKEVMRPATDVQPRMAVLSSTAKAWIGLTKSISTVNLFGTGFGELIQPSPGVCKSWQIVPRGMYYLAVGRKTLDRIVEEGQYPELREQLRPVPMKQGRCRCATVHLHTIENRNVLRKPTVKSTDATIANCLAAFIFGSKEPACLNLTADASKEPSEDLAVDTSSADTLGSEGSNETPRTNLADIEGGIVASLKRKMSNNELNSERSFGYRAKAVWNRGYPLRRKES